MNIKIILILVSLNTLHARFQVRQMKTFLISTLSGIFLNSVECHALGRLEDVYRIKVIINPDSFLLFLLCISNFLLFQDYIESTLVDVETTPETKSFEKIDNLLVNFNMKYRLELLLQETPQDKKLCSSERISKLNNDMYTLVEYFSVSNGEKYIDLIFNFNIYHYHHYHYHYPYPHKSSSPSSL